ncbi:ABC transporter permease [Croceitalea rosinachiae]|uniref:FtsX-like permease family protein n=1 Tax=Croceitalea rosinachiae TaxID=3075596 RepID=A0ABU3AEP4_9FLAO|nr:FtsX-like permease family protein [Croceitalea sp. F388]MDT0607997.1 FtsX-like permease family protein [Croceitalea sp. F388]
MNLEFFIAKRLITGKEHKISISAPIIKIAIAAIAISIVMMLIAIGTSVGLQLKIREKVAAFNGHIQIQNYDNNTSDVSVSPISLDDSFYPKFDEIEGVSHIQGVAVKAGIIRTEETFEGILAKGVGKDYNWKFFKEFLIEGRLPIFSNELNEEVLISKILANKLQLKLEDTFLAIFLKGGDLSKTPNNRRFKIVGVYESGFEELDASYVFIDLRHVQRMNKWDANEVGNFEVFLNDFSQIDQKTIELYNKTPSALDTQNLKGKYYKIFEWLELFDFNTALIISIMIIVGGINMITALLVLILERTQMIGILKALGSRDWSIRKVFLYNATYLIGIGVFWGNIIGLGILLLQKKFQFLKFPNPEEYYIKYIPVQIDISTILLLNLGVVLLCLLMLLIPSYAVAKISPVKAIKFE